MLKVPDRTVLLYSGGMDSLCLAFLRRPDLLLHVTLGERYSVREREALFPLPWGANIEVVAGALNLGRFELDNGIVPGRNAHLVLLASQFGKRILLGATAGDRSHDKDEGFAWRMAELLRHIWQPQHWTSGCDHAVYVAGSALSKAELVRQYLVGGGDPELLARAGGSCYSASSRHCGVCKPCARRWVAFVLNDLDVSFYDHDPRSYFTMDIVARCQRGRYRGALEDRDILDALAKTGGKA